MICCESLFLYHATFLKERNTVAKNLIVVILIFLRVHPIINLLQGYIAFTFQIFQNLRVLCFKDCNASIDGIVNNHIASAFSMLLVGVYHISSTCKKLALLNKGELKFEGSPDDMIELVRGKVWEIFVTDPELQQIKEKYPIISTIPSEGGWEIQIVTEKLEGFDGKAIIPNIEHAYVYFMDYLLKDKMEMYSEKIGGDLFN